jgi:hypothetical protein
MYICVHSLLALHGKHQFCLVQAACSITARTAEHMQCILQGNMHVVTAAAAAAAASNSGAQYAMSPTLWLISHLLAPMQLLRLCLFLYHQRL